MLKSSNKSVAKLPPLPAEAAAKVKAAAQKAWQPTEARGAAPAAGIAEHAGVERWPVKTGTDADVQKVGIRPPFRVTHARERPFRK